MYLEIGILVLLLGIQGALVYLDYKYERVSKLALGDVLCICLTFWCLVGVLTHNFMFH